MAAPGGGETKSNPSGWTVDTLATHVEAQFVAMRRQLDERYSTQSKAIDAAFASAEKAVQAALEAAEKAVNKAESAANDRFEATNEFRGQLTDQAATFMPRAEAEQRFTALENKLDVLTAAAADARAVTNSRLDLMAGSTAGADRSRAIIAWAITAAVGIAAIALFIFDKKP